MTAITDEFKSELSELIWHWMPEVSPDGFRHVRRIWTSIRPLLSGNLDALDAMVESIEDDDGYELYQLVFEHIKTIDPEVLMRAIGDLHGNDLRQYFIDCYSDYPPDAVPEDQIDALVARIKGDAQ